MSKQEPKFVEDIFRDIFENSLTNKTGTCMIVTDDNVACHIVFERGKLIKAKQANLHGVHAIRKLKQIKSARVSFLKGLVMPMEADCALENSDVVLEELGFAEYQQTKLKQKEVESTSKTVKKQYGTYRGQVIYKEVAADKVDKAASTETEVDLEERVTEVATTTKKRVRMYRGQVIEE